MLRFQMQIKQELELMASRLENSSNSSESASDPFPRENILADSETAQVAKDKAKELSLNLKSITQLYNDYAVPFNLWEVWFLCFILLTMVCEFNMLCFIPLILCKSSILTISSCGMLTTTQSDKHNRVRYHLDWIDQLVGLLPFMVTIRSGCQFVKFRFPRPM